MVRKVWIVAVCAAALPLQAGHAAVNIVGQAVQKLHLSPQQLLSLRDFLGAFSRGVQVEGSGNNLFIMRDAASMRYAGAFALTVLSDGSLQIDRVSGPATLVRERSVLVPLRLNPKSRAQVVAALTGSQLLGGVPASSEDVAVAPPPPALPQEQLAGLAPTETAASGSLNESRAVFFRDGSGWSRTLRVTLAQNTAPADALRIADRYYPAMQSDGTQVWRDSAIEIDSDLPMAFGELQARYACVSRSACTAQRAVAPSAFHFVRWGRQPVAAVPPSLLAQLVPAATPVQPEIGTPEPVPEPAPPPSPPNN
ncbi:MAG: hypothetical protein JO056_03975 [Alphaproteobacteria bacterium]|nr:hypothetical protein [Alphaproteobacteria bacterium]